MTGHMRPSSQTGPYVSLRKHLLALWDLETKLSCLDTESADKMLLLPSSLEEQRSIILPYEMQLQAVLELHLTVKRHTALTEMQEMVKYKLDCWSFILCISTSHFFQDSWKLS